MQVHSLNRFHAVGHGTFFTGDIARSDSQAFRWGFDCGSKRPNVVRTVAKRLYLEANRSPIDLLCISHFDADHVNGLKEFLNGRRIRCLALPYLPFDVRLALAGRVEETSATREVVLFLLDPVSFIRFIDPDGLIDTLLLIKGGKGRAPAPDEFSDDPLPGPKSTGHDNREHRELADKEWIDEEYPSLTPVSGHHPRVIVRDHSRPIQLEQFFWEFLFFNRSLPKGLTPKSKVHISQLQKEVRALVSSLPMVSGSSVGTTSTLLSALRNCYEKHFGSSAKARNNISLCLLSRPQGPLQADPCKVFDLPYQSTGCAHTVVPFAAGGKAGLLLTGDILLRPKIRDRMARHFGHQRWTDIHLMQIPHHGSKHSWRSGLGASFAHSVSVFCVPDADPSGKHPHATVLLDLQNTTSVFANYSQAVMHAFHVSGS